MADCRRGSPVLRRITIALSKLCCRLEARLHCAVESQADDRRRRLALTTSTYACAASKSWPANRVDTVHSTASSDFALSAYMHPLPGTYLQVVTSLAGSANTLGKRASQGRCKVINSNMTRTWSWNQVNFSDCMLQGRCSIKLWVWKPLHRPISWKTNPKFEFGWKMSNMVLSTSRRTWILDRGIMMMENVMMARSWRNGTICKTFILNEDEEVTSEWVIKGILNIEMSYSINVD
jgi:hypothetical protein